MKKRGQADARGVATFIGLFILFMIGYILLLPPSERESLLLDYQDKGDGKIGERISEVGVILKAEPGKVGSDSLIILREIADVNLFSATKKDVDDLIETIYVRRSLFSNNVKSLDFNLENLGGIESVSLYFYVTDYKGDLIIDLNSNEILNKEVSAEKMISLPLGFLNKGKNVLTFKASSPSSRVWATNFYTLNDIKLIKEIKVENKEAEVNFYVSEDELNDLNNARFNYFLFCSSVSRADKFFIFVNGNLIFSGLPICDGFSSANIPNEYLQKGNNILKFKITEGDFIVQRGEIELDLKSKKQLMYTFSLSGDEYGDVFSDYSRVFLTVSFGDVSRGSSLDIFVNGNLVNVDTDIGVFSDDISDLVKDGRNVIRLIPSGNFEIENLVVSLE